MQPRFVHGGRMFFNEPLTSRCKRKNSQRWDGREHLPNAVIRVTCSQKSHWFAHFRNMHKRRLHELRSLRRKQVRNYLSIAITSRFGDIGRSRRYLWAQKKLRAGKFQNLAKLMRIQWSWTSQWEVLQEQSTTNEVSVNGQEIFLWGWGINGRHLEPLILGIFDHITFRLLFPRYASGEDCLRVDKR